MDKRKLEHALNKQVPDMKRGCVIDTNYGPITLDADDAEKVADLVEKLLKRKLKENSRV